MIYLLNTHGRRIHGSRKRIDGARHQSVCGSDAFEIEDISVKLPDRIDGFCKSCFRQDAWEAFEARLKHNSGLSF